jgi:hypothetical protein
VWHVYLGALVFGATLLVASTILGGKDVHAGGGGGGHGHHDGGAGGWGWLPIASLRFWIFVMAFGGAAGLGLDALGEPELVSGLGAGGTGWLSGVLAVGVIRRIARTSGTSQILGKELVGATGHLVLPVGPGKDKPGKVRVAFKGRNEDYIAHSVDDDAAAAALPAGTSVLIVAEGERGSLLVAKAEM